MSLNRYRGALLVVVLEGWLPHRYVEGRRHSTPAAASNGKLDHCCILDLLPLLPIDHHSSQKEDSIAQDGDYKKGKFLQFSSFLQCLISFLEINQLCPSQKALVIAHNLFRPSRIKSSASQKQTSAAQKMDSAESGLITRLRV